MKATNKDIIQLLSELNKLKNYGVTTEGMSKVLNFHKTLQAQAKDYADDFRQLMKMAGVEEVDGEYNWSEHEKSDAITSDVKALLDKEVDVKGIALSTKDLVNLTNGMTVGEVTFLKQYLQED